MGDKDKPFSSDDVKLGILDGDGFKELPIVEDGVEYWGYYDAPELKKGMESLSFSFNAENLNKAQLDKLLGIDMQSQIDRAIESSVVVQIGEYILRPKNLKYPNKKRAMRIWKKWRKRFGARPSEQFVIPRAVISYNQEFRDGGSIQQHIDFGKKNIK